MIKENYITKEGLKKLVEQLDNLKNTRRKEVAERIKMAQSLGDLSENSEYLDAREEQAFIEGKIVELEKAIKSAVIIKNASGKGEKMVLVGSVVTVNDGENEIVYTITGSNESDPSEGKVSNESPIGKTLLGHKAGDKVEIEIPSGDILKFNIVKVS